MQYIAISRDGVVIAKSSSPYFLGRSLKNYLNINKLKDSKVYYYSEKELEKFIKKEGSDKYVNIRKQKQGKYVYLALSKSRGKRLFQNNQASELAVEICAYIKKRELQKEVKFKEIEDNIKATKNVSNFEILKFNARSKDAEKFSCLIGMSNKKIKVIANELNTML